jgi:HPt (histidine-containing phosphotransfer) domain-containing protein
MDPLEQSALNDALNQMWSRFLPQMRDRMALLSEATEAYANGALSPVQQKAAREAAHKLSGVLGSFGLANGTVLARELETIFECMESQDGDLAERMRTMTDELSALIESRK